MDFFKLILHLCLILREWAEYIHIISPPPCLYALSLYIYRCLYLDNNIDTITSYTVSEWHPGFFLGHTLICTEVISSGYFQIRCLNFLAMQDRLLHNICMCMYIITCKWVRGQLVRMIAFQPRHHDQIVKKMTSFW